jgi:hypothetical protein
MLRSARTCVLLTDSLQVVLPSCVSVVAVAALQRRRSSKTGASCRSVAPVSPISRRLARTAGGYPGAGREAQSETCFFEGGNWASRGTDKRLRALPSSPGKDAAPSTRSPTTVAPAISQVSISGSAGDRGGGANGLGPTPAPKRTVCLSERFTSPVSSTGPLPLLPLVARPLLEQVELVLLGNVSAEHP